MTPGAGRPPSSAVAAESLGLLGVEYSSGGMTETLIEVDLSQESVADNIRFMAIASNNTNFVAPISTFRVDFC